MHASTSVFRYVLCKHYVTEDFPFYLPQVNYYSAERKPPALLDGKKGRNRENGSSFCPLPFLLSLFLSSVVFNGCWESASYSAVCFSSSAPPLRLLGQKYTPRNGNNLQASFPGKSVEVQFLQRCRNPLHGRWRLR